MKILIGIILFYLPTSFASSLGELGSELLAKGAECNLQNEKVVVCVLDKENFSYPNNTTLIFHQNTQVQEFLVHLHGHSFGPLSSGEDFDSSPEKIIKSFGFVSAILNHPKLAIVIPFTTGKCKDYDQYFARENNFEKYIDEVRMALGNPSKLHLSAHSGGGRTLAKTINKMKSVISSVSLFDAIYSSARTAQYQSWIKLNNKILNLIAIKGNTPYKESVKIDNSLNWNLIFRKNISEIGPYFFHSKKEYKSSKMNFFSQERNKKHYHWVIVRDALPLVLDTLK